jgi:hypothetical protein
MRAELSNAVRDLRRVRVHIADCEAFGRPTTILRGEARSLAVRIVECTNETTEHGDAWAIRADAARVAHDEASAVLEPTYCDYKMGWRDIDDETREEFTDKELFSGNVRARYTGHKTWWPLPKDDQ